MKRAVSIFCLILLISSVSAQTVYFSKINQSDNDPIESRPAQGDTLYLGKTYDLTGVSGVSRAYAYWKDWKLENTNCQPDRIVDINYYKTLTNREAVWLDPAIFTTGNWYYWDEIECNLTWYDFNNGTLMHQDKPFPSDNKLAFRITNAPQAYVWQQQNAITSTEIEGYRSYYEKPPAGPAPYKASDLTTNPEAESWPLWIYILIVIAALAAFALVL